MPDIIDDLHILADLTSTVSHGYSLTLIISILVQKQYHLSHLDMAHSDSDFESPPPKIAHQQDPDSNRSSRRVKKLAHKTSKFVPRGLRLRTHGEGGTSYYVS